MFAYARAEGIELRLDATEIQVRRPPAGGGGRRAFVSGKKKRNTMKATVTTDWRGRALWTDALRPGARSAVRRSRAVGTRPPRHSSDRVTVEHAPADHKRWKQLTRWTRRRDHLPDTYRAIANLVSDRNTPA